MMMITSVLGLLLGYYYYYYCSRLVLVIAVYYYYALTNTTTATDCQTPSGQILQRHKSQANRKP